MHFSNIGTDQRTTAENVKDMDIQAIKPLVQDVFNLRLTDEEIHGSLLGKVDEVKLTGDPSSMIYYSILNV